MLGVKQQITLRFGKMVQLTFRPEKQFTMSLLNAKLSVVVRYATHFGRIFSVIGQAGHE